VQARTALALLAAFERREQQIVNAATEADWFLL
jgi:hypothetical protein